MTRGVQVLGGMTSARFFAEHWQKRPLLVRGAFPRFRDPLTPDDVAGLACEDGVESRLVRTKGGARPWELTYGPLDASVFADLGPSGWTLLVQEVNRFVPGAAALLDAFRFVPNYRVDDVMVSYAEKGGGVGPHLDSYDVFLLQGMGQRRWKFHTRPTADTALVAGLDLRILRRMSADADEVLGPGDLLYLPPGFAHHGTAVSPCLTYSIGFRSPNQGELWRALVETLATSPSAARLYADPDLRPAANPGEIDRGALARARALLRAADLSDDALDRFFARFSTQLKPGHEVTPPSRKATAAAIRARFLDGVPLVRSEECRYAFLPRRAGALLFFYSGRELAVPRAAASLARLAASRRTFAATDLAPPEARAPEALAFLVTLVHEGALRFRARG